MPTVADIMTREVHFLDPGDTVQDAARLMAEVDAGALPVGSAEDLAGILTDRDILIRVVAQGRDPAVVTAGEVMSSRVVTCRATDEVTDALALMRDQQVRRLPVQDGEGRVVGMVGLRLALGQAGLLAEEPGYPGPLR